MKSKKLIAMLMAGCMVFGVTACKKNSEDSKESSSTSANNKKENHIIYTYDYLQKVIPNATEENKVVYKLDDFITLGEYKNVNVEIDKSTKYITDEDVTTSLNTLLQAKATTNQIKEGTVKSGDSINLDFSGLIDGVAFDNGTATAQDYTVGSGQFIPDLDQGLVGLEVGKEYSIPVKFPDTYQSDDLKGKDAVFVVTVNYINETVLPELTDELAKTIATEQSFGEDITTVDKLRAYIKDELQKNADSIYKNNLFSLAIDKIVEGSNYKGTPEGDYNQMLESLTAQLDSYVAQYSSLGLTEEQILKAFYGLDSKDAFLEQANEEAKEQVKMRLAVLSIASKEAMTVSNEEADAIINEYCQYYDMERSNLEKTLEDNDLKTTFEVDVYYYALLDKVMDKVLETVVEVDTPAVSEGESGSAPAEN